MSWNSDVIMQKHIRYPTLYRRAVSGRRRVVLGCCRVALVCCCVVSVCRCAVPGRFRCRRGIPLRLFGMRRFRSGRRTSQSAGRLRDLRRAEAYGFGIYFLPLQKPFSYEIQVRTAAARRAGHRARAWAAAFSFPVWATRIALTFDDTFGQFLSFVIPLLILGLVAPGIADLGRNAGRLLALTAALAYAFTLFLGLRHLPHGAGAVPRIARRRRSRAAPTRPQRPPHPISRSGCHPCSVSCRRWYWPSYSGWGWPIRTA